jgi:hypothetical protein
VQGEGERKRRMQVRAEVPKKKKHSPGTRGKIFRTRKRNQGRLKSVLDVEAKVQAAGCHPCACYEGQFKFASDEARGKFYGHGSYVLKKKSTKIHSPKKLKNLTTNKNTGVPYKGYFCQKP